MGATIRGLDQPSNGIGRLLPNKETRAKVITGVVCVALAALVLIVIAVVFPAAGLIALPSLLGAVVMYGAPVLGLLILTCAIAILVNLSRQAPDKPIDEELGECIPLQALPASKEARPPEGFCADLEADRLLVHFYPLGRVEIWAEPERIAIASKLLGWLGGVFQLIHEDIADRSAPWNEARRVQLSDKIEYGLWRAEALSHTLSYLKNDDKENGEVEPCPSLPSCKTILYATKRWLRDEGEEASFLEARARIASAQKQYAQVKKEFDELSARHCMRLNSRSKEIKHG